MKLVAHDAEHLLDHLRNQPEITDANMIDVLLGSLDFFNNAFEELQAGKQWPVEDETVSALRAQLSGLLHAAREKEDPVSPWPWANSKNSLALPKNRHRIWQTVFTCCTASWIA